MSDSSSARMSWHSCQELDVNFGFCVLEQGFVSASVHCATYLLIDLSVSKYSMFSLRLSGRTMKAHHKNLICMIPWSIVAALQHSTPTSSLNSGLRTCSLDSRSPSTVFELLICCPYSGCSISFHFTCELPYVLIASGQRPQAPIRLW